MSARAAAPPAAILFRPAAAVALVCVWLLAVVGSAILLPGETLELALLGIAATAAWLEVRDAGWDRFQVVVGVAVFAVPLLSTWPARKWQAGVSRLPAPLDAVFNLHALLVLAALVAGGRLGTARLRRARRPLLVALGLLVLGALAGAAANASRSALGDAWIGILVPIALGLAVAGAVRSARDGWRYVALAVTSALVPCGVGIAAYVLSFGVPSSGGDLVFGKLALFRPLLFQDVTFGNVDHFADVVLLLLAPAALALTERALSIRIRIVIFAATIGLLAVLFLVLSRSALTFAFLSLAMAAAYAARPHCWQSLISPVAAAVVVLAVAATPAVSRSIGSLLPGGSGPSSATSQTAPAVDTSETMRVDAIKTGLRVARHHLPFGVGSGRYPAYDPVHTAPHSLFVQVFAEDGVLGALGLAALVLVLVVDAVILLFDRRRPPAVVLLQVACAAGSLAFLADAVSSGAPLALGQLNVWPLLLALLVGAWQGVRKLDA